MSNPTYATGSLLSDVLRFVHDAFETQGLSTSVLSGEAGLVDGADAGDRILFVTDDGDPEMAPIRIGKTIGPSPQMGAQGIARIDMGCIAYIWGANVDGDDPFDFLRALTADVILRNLILTLHKCSPGFITLKKIVKGKNANILSYGAQYLLYFSFKFQINDDPLSSLQNVKTIVQAVIADRKGI